MAAPGDKVEGGPRVWRIATGSWRFENDNTFDGVFDDFDARVRLAYVEQLPWWKVIGSLTVKYVFIFGIPIVAVVAGALLIGAIADIGTPEVQPVVHVAPRPRPPPVHESLRLAEPDLYAVAALPRHEDVVPDGEWSPSLD